MIPTTHQPSGPDPATATATPSAVPRSEAWIVQKYGGTSVGKFLPTIAGVIAPSYLSGVLSDLGPSSSQYANLALASGGAVAANTPTTTTAAVVDVAPHLGDAVGAPRRRLAIVCSARSGQSKALGTTNLLLQAAREALEPDNDDDANTTPDGAASLSNSVASLGGAGGGGGVGGGGGGGGAANGGSAPTPHAFFSRAGRSLSRSGGLNSPGLAATTSRRAALSAMAGASQTASPPHAAQGKVDAPPPPSSPRPPAAAAAADLKGVEASLASLALGQQNPGQATAAAAGVDQPPNGRPAPNDAAAPANPTATATGFNATVDKILADHLEAARRAVTRDADARRQLESDIVDDCERLRDFLLAAKIIEEISPRTRDIVMSIGERLSCRIVVGALLDAGVEAELVGMENVVDAGFLDELRARGGQTAGETGAAAGGGGGGGGEDGLLDQSFYDLLSERMAERLRGARGVPVVTGYFGNVPGSLLSQVGRGYTDLCAALCAVGLGAEELQIWKEVDGVFTADPRKVPTARLIPAITPEEAAELTYYGSEVIHPFTMEQAIKKSVPIRIKNVENPSGGGTVIFPSVVVGSSGADGRGRGSDGDGDGGGGRARSAAPADGSRLEQPRTPSVSGASTPWGSTNGFAGGLNFAAIVPPPPNGASAAAAAAAAAADPARRKLPTAVTIKDDVWVLNVHSNRKTLSHGFFARIFGTLDRHGIIVDLISTSEVHVSMAISATQPGLRRPRALERVRSELSGVGTVSVLRDMSILSLVGTQMRHMVGVAGKMFSTLAEGRINIEMISQGANEINISCVIHRGSALKALNLIHYSVLEVNDVLPPVESGMLGTSFF